MRPEYIIIDEVAGIPGWVWEQMSRKEQNMQDGTPGDPEPDVVTNPDAPDAQPDDSPDDAPTPNEDDGA